MLHVPLKEFIVSFYRLEIAGFPLGRKTALKAETCFSLPDRVQFNKYQIIVFLLIT